VSASVSLMIAASCGLRHCGMTYSNDGDQETAGGDESELYCLLDESEHTVQLSYCSRMGMRNRMPPWHSGHGLTPLISFTAHG